MPAENAHLAAQVLHRMLHHLLLPQHGQDAAPGHQLAIHLRPAPLHLAPDIPQIAIAAARPARGAGVLDVEAGLEREAVGGLGGAVGARLMLVADRGGGALAGEEQRVGVGLVRVEERVGEEGDEEEGEQGGGEGPVGQEVGDLLVQLLEGGLHGHAGWAATRGVRGEGGGGSRRD